MKKIIIIIASAYILSVIAYAVYSTAVINEKYTFQVLFTTPNGGSPSSKLNAFLKKNPDLDIDRTVEDECIVAPDPKADLAEPGITHTVVVGHRITFRRKG